MMAKDALLQTLPTPMNEHLEGQAWESVFHKASQEIGIKLENAWL